MVGESVRISKELSENGHTFFVTPQPLRAFGRPCLPFYAGTSFVKVLAVIYDDPDELGSMFTREMALKSGREPPSGRLSRRYLAAALAGYLTIPRHS